MGLFGCAKEKYQLKLDSSDFESKKTAYAAGEKVTVYYDLIATDTDYWFYTDSEDVELKQSYDNQHGYIFSFTMPAHDVTQYVKSRNSMEPMNYFPEPEEEPGAESEPEPEEEIQVDPWFCPECGCKNTGRKCVDCGYEQ